MNLNMQKYDVTDQQLIDYNFMKALANTKVTPILPTAIVSHFDPVRPISIFKCHGLSTPIAKDFSYRKLYSSWACSTSPSQKLILHPFLPVLITRACFVASSLSCLLQNMAKPFQALFASLLNNSYNHTHAPC